MTCLATQLSAMVSSNLAPVLQGFIDAHLHLMMGAQTLENLNLNGVRSQEEMATALASAAGMPLDYPTP